MVPKIAKKPQKTGLSSTSWNRAGFLMENNHWEKKAMVEGFTSWMSSLPLLDGWKMQVVMDMDMAPCDRSWIWGTTEQGQVRNFLPVMFPYPFGQVTGMWQVMQHIVTMLPPPATTSHTLNRERILSVECMWACSDVSKWLLPSWHVETSSARPFYVQQRWETISVELPAMWTPDDNNGWR